MLCDNRLCWWTSGMNKSMLDLYKKLDSQERGEKREKRWTRKWIYSPSLLYFPLSLLFLSHKYSSLLTTWQEAINTQILEYFVKAKLLKLQWSTLLSASLRRLFRNLWRIVIIIFLRECHVLQSLIQTVHVHMDRPKQLAVNHRWRHLLGWSVLANSLSMMRRVSPGHRWSRKIRPLMVRQCTFLPRNLVVTSSPMVGWQPSQRSPTKWSRRT